MNTTDFEKISNQLAAVATKQAAIEDFLSSDAGRYLIGGGLGAGVGALVGAAQPNRDKKKRNMLYYSGLGGLGGLGLAHVLNTHSANRQPAADKQPAPAVASADGPNVRLGPYASGASSVAAAAATKPIARDLVAKPVQHSADAATAKLTAAQSAAMAAQQAADDQAATALSGTHATAADARRSMRDQLAVDVQARKKELAALHAKRQRMVEATVKARALSPSVVGKKLPKEMAAELHARLNAHHARETLRAEAPLTRHDDITARLSKRQLDQMNKLRSSQTATNAAATAAFKGRMTRRARGLGLLGKALEWGPTAAAAGAGWFAPDYLATQGLRTAIGE